MKKPAFYYTALDFGKCYEILSNFDIRNFVLDDTYEFYTRFGMYRGNHYQILFTRQDYIVTVTFSYVNFNNKKCDFNIRYNLSYDYILKDYIDFKEFCLTISFMIGSPFWNKGFQSKSKFIG